MTHNSLIRILARTAAVAAVATVGASAVFVASSGAAPTPPFNTTTTVKASPGSLVTGEAVVFTATVKQSPHSAPTPVGQVVFTITGGGGFVGTCGSGNTVTLSSGTAQCSFSGGLPAASSPFTVSAAYTDTVNTNYKPSSGSLNQVVSPGGTTTNLASSSNPSVTGQPVTFVATVGIQSPAAGTLSGSVTFSGVTCDGGNTVAVSSNMASCSISAGLHAAGSPYTVTATYGSDPNFAGSTSNKVKQVVNPGATTVVLSATPNNCTGDVCSVPAGQPVSFTGTVTANSPSTGTPTGSLVFSVIPAGGKAKHSLTCDGGNTVALSGVHGSDTATCSFAAGLPASVYYSVTATLADPNYTGSSATLYETSGQLSTNTSTTHPMGVTAGETFDITATVTETGPPGSLAPTGYVEISVCGSNSNGNNGCQGAPQPLDPGTGQATLVVGGGEFPGQYTVSANYLGDSNYLGSTAKKAAMHVDLDPTAIAIQSSENPSVDGDAVTLTAVVTAANGGAGSTLIGPPTGAVTFTITDQNNTTYSCASGNVVTLDNGSTDEGVAQCYLPPGTLTNLNGPSGSTTYTVQVNYPSDGTFQASQEIYKQVVVPPAG